jgi:ATP-dependent Clp protease adaptor protein ClpS
MGVAYTSTCRIPHVPFRLTYPVEPIPGIEPPVRASSAIRKIRRVAPLQEHAAPPVGPGEAWYIGVVAADPRTVARMIDTVVKPRTQAKPKTERPKLHKVILVNDDFTPREFVVTVLKAEFRMTEDQAHKVMITAHRRGVCVVAVFTKDVAETKATRATDAGRAKGYPLLFTTEPEE